MNDCSVPAGGTRERMSRRMYGLSLACALAGLAVVIGGFIVLLTSVFDEVGADTHLVIPVGDPSSGGCHRRVRGAKACR